jgi:hypothetical protein
MEWQGERTTSAGLVHCARDAPSFVAAVTLE